MTTTKLHGSCTVWKPKLKLNQLEALSIRNPWIPILRSEIKINKTDRKRIAGGLQPLSAELGLPLFRGAVFTGPPGNGRHCTAAALAGNLGADLCHIRIFGADIDFEEPMDALAAVASALETAKDAKGLCLFLDEPEHCRHSMMIQSFLYSKLCEEDSTMYLIVVTDHVTSVMSGLQQILTLCHLEPPNFSERDKWLAEQSKQPILITFSDTSIDAISMETDDFTWKQMNQLITGLRRLVFFQATGFKSIPELLAHVKAGDVSLNEDQVMPLIKAIKEQHVPVAVPAAGFVAAMPPVQQPQVNIEDAIKELTEDKPNAANADSIFDEPAKPKSEPLGDSAAMKKEAAELEHIEEQSIDDVLSVLGLMV